MPGRMVSVVTMVLLVAGCGLVDEDVWQSGPSWQKPSRFTTDPNAGKPSDKTLDLGDGVRMEFVLIPAGSFSMGSPRSEKGREPCEGPVRQVQITKPFYLGKYEVTQDQFFTVMGKNYSYEVGRDIPAPASWYDAAAFCMKVGGRLPTEAEWEYACRAGSSGRFCWGDSEEDLKEYAWYSYVVGGMRQHPVGLKKPNSLGLYDMHGNISEWCQDYWAEDYQDAGSIDPKGPSRVKGFGVPAEARVVRGSSASDADAADYRCACRRWGHPGRPNTSIYAGPLIGFRVVLDHTLP